MSVSPSNSRPLWRLRARLPRAGLAGILTALMGLAAPPAWAAGQLAPTPASCASYSDAAHPNVLHIAASPCAIAMSAPGSTTTTDSIAVDASASPADITLSGVSIDVSGAGAAAFDEPVLGESVTLTLEGHNSLASASGFAGLQTGSDLGTAQYTWMTITSTSGGSLIATGGAQAAGIGGGSGQTAGQITITGDAGVTATGGAGAAGIGGGYGGEMGFLTIDTSVQVQAAAGAPIGGYSGAPIGQGATIGHDGVGLDAFTPAPASQSVAAGGSATFSASVPTYGAACGAVISNDWCIWQTDYSWTFSPAGGGASSGAGTANPLTLAPVTASMAGSYAFTVELIPYAQALSPGPQATFVRYTSPAWLRLTVTAPPSITTTSLNGGATCAPYDATLAADNGPASWKLTSGALPAGLSLNAATGEISGTPTATGAFKLTFIASNADGDSAPVNLTLTISAGTDCASPPPPTGAAAVPTLGGQGLLALAALALMLGAAVLASRRRGS